MEQQTATETDDEVVEEDKDTWIAGCRYPYLMTRE